MSVMGAVNRTRKINDQVPVSTMHENAFSIISLFKRLDCKRQAGFSLKFKNKSTRPNTRHQMRLARVLEKAFRTNLRTYGRTDRRTDGQSLL